MLRSVVSTIILSFNQLPNTNNNSKSHQTNDKDQYKIISIRQLWEGEAAQLLEDKLLVLIPNNIDEIILIKDSSIHTNSKVSFSNSNISKGYDAILTILISMRSTVRQSCPSIHLAGLTVETQGS